MFTWINQKVRKPIFKCIIYTYESPIKNTQQIIVFLHIDYDDPNICFINFYLLHEK